MPRRHAAEGTPPASTVHQEAVLAVCAWCDDYARGFYAHCWRPVPAAFIREAKRLGLTTDGICDRCRPRVLLGSAAPRPCCGAHAGLARLRAERGQDQQPAPQEVAVR